VPGSTPAAEKLQAGTVEQLLWKLLTGGCNLLLCDRWCHLVRIFCTLKVQ